MTDERKDLPPVTSPNFLEKLREAVQVYLGNRGDKLDRGLTLRDLADAGIVDVSARYLSVGGRVTPIAGVGTAVTSSYEADLTPPPTPTYSGSTWGITLGSASAAISNLLLECDAPTYSAGHGHAKSRLYGATWASGDLPVFASAALLTEFSGTVGSYATNPATTWHLWLTWVTVDGVESTVPAGGTNGVVATTGQDVETLLSVLSNKIGESELAITLGARIDLIDAPGSGLVDQITALTETGGTPAAAAASATAAAASAAEATTAKTDAILAKGGAVSAASDAVAAKNLAVSANSDAQTSATSAATSATNAAGSASNAAISATASASSASDSGISATAAATSASNASTYATNSETASTASNTAKVAAESALSDALGSATAASLSASTASTKATDAETSAAAADTSATTASTKAGEASTSATNAATSETNASGSASTAATQAGVATSAAGAAGTSSTNAGVSATNSATSATNAAGSASSAAGSVNAIMAITTGFDAAVAWNFDTSVEGWTSDNTSPLTVLDGALVATSTTNDPMLYPPAIAINGAANTLVRARIKRISGPSWQGQIYYYTAGHSGPSELYSKTISDTTVIGEWRVLEWDMSNLTTGGTDWIDHTITGFRLDLGNDPADVFHVDWITIGRVSPVAYSAAILEEATTRSDETGALADRATTLEAAVVGINGTLGSVATVSDVATAKADAISAAAETTATVQSQLDTGGSTQLAIATAQTTANTAVTNTAAIASTVTTLQATVEGNTASIQTEATTRATQTGELYAQYTVKLDVGGKVSGYGLASSATSSEFAVRADRFSISAPAGTPDYAAYVDSHSDLLAAWSGSGEEKSTWGYSHYTVAGQAEGRVLPLGVTNFTPFVVQVTPTTINGVAVPAGVYMSAAFIKDATITNAKIADLAVDNAKIASLSAAKLTIGDGTVGGNLKSSNYVAGSAGWIVQPGGYAEYNNVVVRGTVYATAGLIGGNTIDATSIHSGATGYGTGAGFYLGSDGAFSLGDKLTWNGAALTINGSGTFSGALSAATGTFSGALSAATGSFSGSLYGSNITGATGTFEGVLSAGTVDVESLVGTTTIYTTPGSYIVTVPANYTKIQVSSVGGGGGGGAYIGGGGGGGGLSIFSMTVTPGQQFTVYVGAGGAGGSGSVNGGTGGSSGLSGYSVANGGVGGLTWTNGYAGGVGGSGTSANGLSGTAAASYKTSLNTTYWVGGHGGNSGANSAAGGAATTTGGKPGGGGGGSSGSYSSYPGLGGDGRVVVELFNPNGVIIRSEWTSLTAALQRQGIAIV